MAKIRTFKELSRTKPPKHHTDVDCGYSILTTEDGPVLHLETYGSDDRAIPGKVSQSLLINRTAAAQLSDLLKRAFPGLQ